VSAEWRRGKYLISTDPARLGLARVVTDHATVAYLADVFVLAEHRGRGLSKWLMETVVGHPELQGFRRFLLNTQDAHGLYRQFGFTSLAHPEWAMERVDLDGYTR
jgi:GNAT superfamily N-acetyltransferase